MADGVVVQVANGDVEVNFGTDGSVAGAIALTTANRLTKVSGVGAITMASVSEPTAGDLTGVASLAAATSAGLTIKSFSGSTVVTLGPGSGQAAAFADGITCSSVTATGASGIATLQSATQDAIRLLGRAGGTSSHTLTLTTAALTASRTATFPDAAITVAGSASALTASHIPYTVAVGLLDGTPAFTLTGVTAARAQLNILTDGAVPCIVLNGASGVSKTLRFATGGVGRWQFSCVNTAEGGSDTGSPWSVIALTDAGAVIDTPLTIVRAAGGAITLARPTYCTSTTDATTTSDGSVRLSGGLSVAKATVGLTLKATSTADGAITTAGKITAKVAVPGSFADLAAVQTYLASILT
jgi:hypothetical protein